MIIEVKGHYIEPIELGPITITCRTRQMQSGWVAEARRGSTRGPIFCRGFGDIPDDAVRRLMDELRDTRDEITAALAEADIGCGGESMMPFDEVAE